MSSRDIDELDLIVSYAEQIKDSELLSIIIEGKDDLLLYNEFEDIYELYNPMVSVLPVGGRNTVLGVFKQLKDTPHINKAIFIVDKDQWVIKGVDADYQHDRVICTHGYSFENDIFIDGSLENDMKAKNADIFNAELPIVLKWYALEMDRILGNRPTKRLSLDVDNLFNCIPEYTNPEPNEVFPQSIFDSLQTEYPQLLRGKTLIKFYTRVMNNREGFKNAYTQKATIENTCKLRKDCLNRIFNDVDKLINQ